MGIYLFLKMKRDWNEGYTKNLPIVIKLENTLAITYTFVSVIIA